MGKFRAIYDNALTDRNGNINIIFKAMDTDKYACKQVAEELETWRLGGKERLIIDIKQYKSKRSLNQNALFWVLCDKLCETMTGKKRGDDIDDTYLMLLEKANVDAQILMGLPETKEELLKVYRVVKVVDSREYNGKKMEVFKCYLGSSHFDTKQMTELIDLALDLLAEYGINDSEVLLIREELGR